MCSTAVCTQTHTSGRTQCARHRITVELSLGVCVCVHVTVCACLRVCVSACLRACAFTYQCASCYVWHAGTVFRLPFSSLKHFERLDFQVACVPRTSYVTFVSFPVFSAFIALSLALIFTRQPRTVCVCAAWKAPSFICLQCHSSKRLAAYKTVIGYWKFSVLSYKYILCSVIEVMLLRNHLCQVSSFLLFVLPEG